MKIYREIGKILTRTEYSILHGWQSLPEQHDSDLDIAINPRDLNLLEESLANHDAWMPVQMVQYESTCFCFILAFKDRKKLKFLQVDADTDYRANGLIYFSISELIGDRRKWKDYWVTSPETEFAYLLVKKTIKGVTPEHQKGRLKCLIREIGEKNAHEIASKLFGGELGTRLLLWIRDDNWTEQESNLPKLKRSLTHRILKRDPWNPVKYWIDEVKRVISRCRYPNGLHLAILGPDGAGKSTLIDNLESHLDGAFPRTASFHLRPHVLDNRNGNSPVTNPHGKPARSFMGSTIKIAYYVADYLFGYIFKLYPKFVRSTLVMFDRYYNDLLIDPVRYRYGGSSRFADLGSYLVPSPDLFIVLDAPEKELLKRKQEVKQGELTRQRREYLITAAKLPNAYVLDASCSPEKIAGSVSEIITDYLHNRYTKRRKSYFRNNAEGQTFDWLTSVLLADANYVKFPRTKNENSAVKMSYDFYYIPVKGGRGYLLPKNRKAALNGLNLYNAQSGKAKFLKSILSTNCGGGLSNLFMKSVKIVSQNEPDTNDYDDSILLEHIMKQMNLSDAEFAISLGTPGPNRKPVIQINTRDGIIAGYAKVGWNESTNSQVKNESDAIEILSRSTFDSFYMPKVLQSFVWNDRYVAIFSSPGNNLQSAPNSLSATYLNALLEFAEYNPVKMSLSESSFWSDFIERVKSVDNEYYRHILEQKSIPAIKKTLGYKEIYFHVSHGDFAPWNAYVKDGRLFLYDWEGCNLRMPAGWDLFHFVFQTSVFLENKSAVEMYDSFFRKSHHDISKTYWNKLGIDEDTARILSLLYILDRISVEAVKEHNNLKEMNILCKIVLLYLNGGMDIH